MCDIDIDVIKKENQYLKKLLLNANECLKEHKEPDEHENIGLHKAVEFLTDKVATIEKERREEKIASILQGAYSEKNIKDAIECFAKSGMIYEDIHKAVEPLKTKRTKCHA